MISGVSVDRCLHTHNNSNIDIYGLHDHLPREEGSTDQRNTDNEHKTPHLRNYIGNLSCTCVNTLLSIAVCDMLNFDASEASLVPFTLSEEDKYLMALAVVLIVQLDERLVSCLIVNKVLEPLFTNG